MAHLLDANLESTTEFGINEYSEHLHEHIFTQVSPAGKLHIAGLLDGNLSIGGQLINETPDGTFSLLVARTDEFLDTEFVVTNSLVLPSPIPSYEGDHILDFQFHENGKFLVSQSFGDSGTSYYIFAADGNLTETFLMPEGNNLDGLQKLEQHGFISGWQTYKDGSGNTLAILLDNNSSGAISSLPRIGIYSRVLDLNIILEPKNSGFTLQKATLALTPSVYPLQDLMPFLLLLPILQSLPRVIASGFGEVG